MPLAEKLLEVPQVFLRGSDFYYVPADDPETAVSRIIELVKTRIPKRFGLDPIRDAWSHRHELACSG